MLHSRFQQNCQPLHELTGNKQWARGPSHAEALFRLRESLLKELILALPVDDKPFRVEVDCSQYAMGGVLSQFINGKWHPVAYRSQCLLETERNYKIHDRELLAFMRALEDWRSYLLGATHQFKIWTDHQNLTYFQQPHKLNRRQVRACLVARKSRSI